MNDLYESYGDEDFMKTESQLKVAKLKKCRKECSLVINGLFVSGVEIAQVFEMSKIFSLSWYH